MFKIPIKFDNVLLDCMILQDEILSNKNATTTILCIHQIDVDNYSNLVLETLFSSNEIFDVAWDTNVFEFQHVQQRINDFHFDHIKKIAIGALVLLTKNIDISKGVVNGAFAIITFIKFNENRIISSIIIEIINIGFQFTLKQCNYKMKYTYEKTIYNPILLGYVITGHKVQQTIISNKIVIKVEILLHHI